MARASTFTLLSLDRYARILGINPPHFNQLVGSGTIFPSQGQCSDIWFQYAWQNADQVSREDIAREIRQAEEDVSSFIGYWPASKWIVNEIHLYPRFYRREYYGTGFNPRGQLKSIKPKFGKFIEAGQRASTLLEADATVTYSDPDGDGFSELATVTVATALTEACEINIYFPGQSGSEEWEIRPAKTKSISGGSWTGTYDSWLFVDPDLWEAFPEAAVAINLDTSNFVSTVDIYREFTDFTEKSAEFFWEPKPKTLLISTLCTSCSGTGCAACTLTTQDGCVHVRDVDLGLVVPQPATYDTDNSQWNQDNWTQCREPDQVKIWYRAGELDQKFLNGTSCEEMPLYLAQAIAWIATARLERPLCHCSNVNKLANSWRLDMAELPDTGSSFQVPEDVLSNPFGTRKGEVMAFKRLSGFVEHEREVALI